MAKLMIWRRFRYFSLHVASSRNMDSWKKGTDRNLRETLTVIYTHEIR